MDLRTAERLYYADSYLREFRAAVIETADEGRRVCLDRTAFYPASGGQPHDTGTIGNAAVVEVIDEGERIAHITAAPVPAGEAECRIDWPRRFDHMQQHTGQHLLSAVLVELYGFETVGFHLGAEVSTIDLGVPSIDPRQAAAAETRANEIATENRPVTVAFEDRGAAQGLRKPSDREGEIRIVSIEGLDRSACGGTHVRATGEIGPILIRKLDKAHGVARIEFLCGARALRRARADYDALGKTAKVFGCAVDETPAVAVAQAQALEAAEKARRKLAAELARHRGRELYAAAAPGPGGLRIRVERQTLDDDLRACAQAFTANPKAVFVAACEDPPAVLAAASADSGLHAGNIVKSAVSALGGRGGGNAQLAQGSVPSRDAIEAALAAVLQQVGNP